MGSYNIVEKRKMFYLASIIVIMVGLMAMPVNLLMGNEALNFDVEFSGGLTMRIDLEQDFNNDDIAKIINDETGQSSPQVQRVVGTNEVMVKMQSVTTEQRIAMIEAISKKYNISSVDNVDIRDVSATISGEMQKTALLAIAVASVAMLVYIIFRFRDFNAGLSAIAANLHDILLLIAVYALFRIPVNNSFVAALLTILGYSINATIVIFDRIRENRKSSTRSSGFGDIVNKSIHQTLGRSINTSLTTLLTIACVYIFGVQSVKQFALPLIIGIIGGTYSSIFISGSIWYSLSSHKPRSKKSVNRTTKSS